MNKKLNNCLFFIAMFLFYNLYSAVVVAILNKIGIHISKFGIHNKNICLIVIDISCMIITYLFYRKELNSELKKFFKNFFNFTCFGIEMWIVGIVLMIASNLIIKMVLPTATAANEDAVQAMLLKTPIYISFSACVFAPFMEEMIFRKSLKHAISNDYIFIIMSGLLFGLVHNLGVIGTTSMIYIIPYGLFGCVFAYVYTKKKDIFVPIFMHMLHNTLLVLVSLYNMGLIFK